jgi:lysyl-tRNA synthetase class 2
MAVDDWRPSASWRNLQLRAELLRQTRAFFDQRGFLEVETPILSADTVVDRHLDPLSVVLPDSPRQPDKGRVLWLQTSPELAMKRLMASGGQAIYQITRAVRGGESGPLHNPEFTIVEWYRRGDTMDDGMQLLSTLAQRLLGVNATRRICYRDAFLQHAGVDCLTCTPADLARAAEQRGLAVPQGFNDDLDAWRNLMLSEVVAPQLGQHEPVIVYDFPASQAMLARVRNEDPPVAERFELFFRGIELANGYHELLDADELRRRTAAANQQRVTDGKPALPEGNRLLAAMEAGLPDCTGVALGFDRIVMLAAGAQSLADVLPFPFDRA